jgi:AraC family transcriptional regulator, transcriptional activator of pobA
VTHAPIRRGDLLGNGAPVIAGRYTPPDRAKPRWQAVTHDYASIAFYTHGRARLEQNGEWNVREGDVVLIPAGDPHRMLEMQHTEYWGLALRAPCFAADTSLLAPIERVRDGGAAVVHVPSHRHAFLEELFRELERSHATEAVQRSLLTLILAEVDRAGNDGAPRATRHGAVVVESLRFIERNCLRRLTLNEVASAVGRTPAYVTTALTQATGRSAGDWIISGRMAEARRLLLHSEKHTEQRPPRGEPKKGGWGRNASHPAASCRAHLLGGPPEASSARISSGIGNQRSGSRSAGIGSSPRGTAVRYSRSASSTMRFASSR